MPPPPKEPPAPEKPPTAEKLPPSGRVAKRGTSPVSPEPRPVPGGSRSLRSSAPGGRRGACGLRPRDPDSGAIALFDSHCHPPTDQGSKAHVKNQGNGKQLQDSGTRLRHSFI